MAEASPSAPGSSSSNGIVGRVRGASLSLINANPQLGMWQATGCAIAQAPNLTELRDAGSGGDNIAFNAQGHSARIAVHDVDGGLALVRTNSRRPTFTTPNFDKDPAQEPAVIQEVDEPVPEITGASSNQQQAHWNLREKHQHLRQRRHSLYEKHKGDAKEKWGPTILNGLKAFWKFFKTPSGFLITIYGLNIVAWGAMLFFLLLKAAPAMNHPSADDNSSPRKIWLEICSQILNALFCVTAFGLAPWRFRDLYNFERAAHFKNQAAMLKLAEQNKSWFRPPAWATKSETGETTDSIEIARPSLVRSSTFTGKCAPPTALWKLGFTIWMMVLNTLLQVVLCYYMWAYNRINRPTWATGTFIALGCAVGMFAGLMSWWEGRKVKKIEGPQVEIVKEDV
ncbi:hypothetical protein EDB81DRAFT_809664 [Dactylonectria macrodidyma]|uniref:Alpha-L-rhamnosidase C n=1 Tax=Dactylonectria macrodidyma TaxID=307937 RepID=A0A9P9DYX0_9HYPO|nr:hypothetical protein EDB81DRAFT_809664 [Dactylonectria macrodidyma]